MSKLFPSLVLALTVICIPAKSSEVRDVSAIQLIANPQQFDGSRVRLIAFLRLEFEGNALYLHREDYEKSLLQNAIAISLTDKQEKTSQKLSGGYVIVEGVYSAQNRGHLELFAGSIQQVTRIQSWEWRRRKRR